jgi:hypothetical protein
MMSSIDRDDDVECKKKEAAIYHGRARLIDFPYKRYHYSRREEIHQKKINEDMCMYIQNKYAYKYRYTYR